MFPKKNNFITSSQVKTNTLGEIGASLSRSTIKRHLQKYKQTLLVWLKSKTSIHVRLCQKTSKTACTLLKQILWTDETKMNFYQNVGSRKVREGEQQLMIWSTVSAKHGGVSVMAWARMSASETSLLVCVDDVTAGRNDSRMDCDKAYRAVLCSDLRAYFSVTEEKLKTERPTNTHLKMM